MPDGNGAGQAGQAADPIAAVRAVEKGTFDLLKTSVAATGRTIGAPATLPVTARIRKSLPPSYLAAGGGPPTGALTTTDADFGCDVQAEPAAPLAPPPSTISWGEIISYAMRQPVLATRLGILYGLRITLPAAQAQAFIYNCKIIFLSECIYEKVFYSSSLRSDSAYFSAWCATAKFPQVLPAYATFFYESLYVFRPKYATVSIATRSL